jgi:YegS/Rv2252/BmrU family lipid kinase
MQNYKKISFVPLICYFCSRFEVKSLGMKQKNDIWLIVVNVFAASKKAGELWRRAESLLKHRGLRYECRYTGDSGNACRIAADASREGYRRFVAVGGDGTVHDVLNGIMSYVDSPGNVSRLEDFYLSVLPMGSGNDWIRSLGVSQDLMGIVDLMASGSFGRQDVVKVSLLDDEGNTRSVTYMANIGGVGIDADVCRIVNVNKKMGMSGKVLYVKALIQCLMNRKPVVARVLCDGFEVFNGNCFSIAFGVGKYSGGGMRQTADALMDDGFLDMTLIPELGMLKIAKEAPKLFTGTFTNIPELVVKRARSIVVIPEGGMSHVEVDGEVVGTAPVCLEVMGPQINVLQ